MKNMDKLIEMLCDGTDYETILSEILKHKNEGNNEIIEVLNIISKNDSIDKEEKKILYKKLFDYVEYVNKCFQCKIKDTYEKGFKHAIVMGLIQSGASKEDEEEDNADIALCLSDFITKRLASGSRLKEEEDYEIILKDIEEESKKIKNIEDLELLYMEKSDLENIDSYQIGFRDAIKIINSGSLNDFDKKN